MNSINMNFLSGKRSDEYSIQMGYYITVIDALNKKGLYEQSLSIGEAALSKFKHKAILYKLIETAILAKNETKLDEFTAGVYLKSYDLDINDFVITHLKNIKIKNSTIQVSNDFKYPLCNRNYSSILSLVTTRYFVSSANYKGMDCTDYDNPTLNKYIKDRARIFLTKCYPSIIKQLSDSDTWILLISKEFKKRISALLGSLDKKVIICDENEYQSFLSHIDRAKYSSITNTMVDNDDSLAVDYLHCIKYSVNELKDRSGIIVFPYGAQYGDAFGLLPFMCNTPHFFTQFAKEHDYDLNVYAIDHTKLYESSYKVFSLNTNLPMWLEYIHDSNQANNKIYNHYLPFANTQWILAQRFNWSSYD